MTTQPTYEELLTKFITVEQENALLEQGNALLEQENALLKQQIEWFRRQLFGAKSERVTPINKEQLVLFPDLKPVEQEKVEKVSSHTRRKPHVGDKIAVPKDIPIEKVIIDLPEEEKVCQLTGQPLVKIGEEVTRKLAHRPGYFFIREFIRPKYASSSKEAENSVRVASLPSFFLNRCYADASLLASIIIWKYVDHLPLYRQEECLAREGVIIPRQTLSNWVLRTAEALRPLYEAMERAVLKSGNTFVDETPIDLLSKGNGSTVQAYMWVLCGGAAAPYQVYRFFKNRKHENADKLLGDYRGILHSDKYGAYVKLAERKQIIWCPCFAHIRRKFYEAESGDSEFRSWVLRQFRHLFMLERVAWNRSPDERLKIRQEKEIPILNKLIEAIKKKLNEGKLLPKSKLHEAIIYFISLTPYLKNYTQHPEARMDNNTAERAVRPLAIGRKNWLFVGSEEGGEASATLFSLVQTCRALNINPKDYLEDVMNKLADHPANKVHELLPDHWIKTHS
jgi:transposase